MKPILLTLFLYFSLSTYADEAVDPYTSSFSEYATAIMQTAESDPQQALQSVKNYQPSSQLELAQQHLLYTHIYGALDYPDEMLLHSELGLGAIDADKEPWISHFLTIAKVDALDRLGKGTGHTKTLNDTIQWAQDNNHRTLAAAAMIQLSYLFIAVEDYNQALLMLQQAEATALEEHHLLTKSDVGPHIAGIYVYRNEYALALPYFEASYQNEKAENNILGMSIQLFELGRANIELKNTELGINQLQQSIELSESINDVQGVAYASTELANHLIEQNEFTQAKNYLAIAGRVFEDASNTYMLFDNRILLIKLHTKSGEFAEAEHFLSLAQTLNETHQLRYGQVTINTRKAHLFAAMGDHQQAFDLFVEATEQRMKLESEHSAEKLHEIRARYEVEQNAINNQLLAEQNSAQSETIASQSKQRVMLIVVLGLMASCLALLIFFYRKLSKQSSRLHELANFDDLTGLRNRPNIVSSIRRKLNKIEDDEAITLVMIDLDRFKHINDTYGHALGDKVLKMFGSLCQELAPHTRWIGRLGGEEFLVGFLNTHPAKINHLIDQLRIKTEAMPHQINAPGLKVAMSAGTCHAHGKHRFRDILKCADEAMYQAKENGRNQIVTIELD